MLNRRVHPWNPPEMQIIALSEGSQAASTILHNLVWRFLPLQHPPGYAWIDLFIDLDRLGVYGESIVRFFTACGNDYHTLRRVLLLNRRTGAVSDQDILSRISEAKCRSR